MTVNNNINIKERIARKIYKLSESTKKNASYHVNKALKNYFDEIKELSEAQLRLKNKKDKTLSSKDFRKSLGF